MKALKNRKTAGRNPAASQPLDILLSSNNAHYSIDSFLIFFCDMNGRGSC